MDDKLIVHSILTEKKILHISEIEKYSELRPFELNEALFGLEIDGKIKRLPGNQYEILEANHDLNRS